MSERDVHIAEELYLKNILINTAKATQVFYTVRLKKNNFN